jgi:hypothetical protein
VALELHEHLPLAEVAEVQDQVGRGGLLQAARGNSASAARQMGVCDQREADG